MPLFGCESATPVAQKSHSRGLKVALLRRFFTSKKRQMRATCKKTARCERLSRIAYFRREPNVFWWRPFCKPFFPLSFLKSANLGQSLSVHSLSVQGGRRQTTQKTNNNPVATEKNSQPYHLKQNGNESRSPFRPWRTQVVRRDTPSRLGHANHALLQTLFHT